MVGTSSETSGPDEMGHPDSDPRHATSAVGADAPVPDPDGQPSRRRVGLIAATAFAVAMAATWIWMLFIYDPGLLIDELADRTFPTAAEQICAAADDEIADLPPAETTRDPVERAEVIEDANTTLSAMLGQLAPLAPTEPPEAAEAVDEWLGDWATHLGDRQRYAEELAGDPEARFTETPKGSKQISLAIDSFAQVNHMPSCATPGDV